MRITGAKCEDCGKVAGRRGQLVRRMAGAQKRGLDCGSGAHRCPACSGARKKRLDAEARHGAADR